MMVFKQPQIANATNISALKTNEQSEVAEDARQGTPAREEAKGKGEILLAEAWLMEIERGGVFQ